MPSGRVGAGRFRIRLALEGDQILPAVVVEVPGGAGEAPFWIAEIFADGRQRPRRILEFGDARPGVVIGDVSGKGTSAAFYMAEFKGVIQTLSRLNPVVIPLQSMRLVLFAGTTPDWIDWSAYLVVSLLALVGAGFVFRVLRRGFADVL